MPGENDAGRMDDGGQAETVLGPGRRHGRLRQADSVGRRDHLHGGAGHGRAQRQPVGGHRDPGGVRVASRLENVPAELRHPAGRLPQRVRLGPRLSSLLPSYHTFCRLVQV